MDKTPISYQRKSGMYREGPSRSVARKMLRLFHQYQVLGAVGDALSQDWTHLHVTPVKGRRVSLTVSTRLADDAGVMLNGTITATGKQLLSAIGSHDKDLGEQLRAQGLLG
jgi:hypothetical protein